MGGRVEVDGRVRAPDLPAMTVLSVMSGTSLDGMDAVAARLEWRGGRLEHELLHRANRPYPAELRSRLQRALRPETSDVSLLTQLHAEVGHAYAELCGAVCDELRGSAGPVGLVALSGQTVYHIPRVDPAAGWLTPSTLQLGEAAFALERCRVPVACDFRQSDLAAGGQGAPLVSFGDLLLYGREGVARAVHNLGGISNLTLLPADLDPDGVIAFDTGPANCLLDEAAERFAGLPYDADGRLAAAGRVDEALLARLLEHPYLRLPAPKTTGRELFQLDLVLEQALGAGPARELLAAVERAGEPPRPGAGGAGAPGESSPAPAHAGASPAAEARGEPARFTAADLLATLTAFTAESIARAYRDLAAPVDEVLLAGGGALNPVLRSMLAERLPGRVLTFSEAGYDARDREALAFAVMAYFGYHGQANTLPNATGARCPVVAGKYLRPWPPGRGAPV